MEKFAHFINDMISYKSTDEQRKIIERASEINKIAPQFKLSTHLRMDK